MSAGCVLAGRSNSRVEANNENIFFRQEVIHRRWGGSHLYVGSLATRNLSVFL